MAVNMEVEKKYEGRHTRTPSAMIKGGSGVSPPAIVSELQHERVVPLYLGEIVYLSGSCGKGLAWKQSQTKLFLSL